MARGQARERRVPLGTPDARRRRGTEDPDGERPGDGPAHGGRRQDPDAPEGPS